MNQSKKGKVWAGIGGLVAIIIGGIFAVEGGYVNDPNDAGGKTNYGITERVAREHGYSGDMKYFPKEAAESIYAESYIFKPNFHLILERSPAVGMKVIDAGVNVGVKRSAQWFQQTMNDLSRGGRDYSLIPVDGSIGLRSVQAYDALVRKRGAYKACELTLKLLDSYQGMHYAKLGKGQANSSFVVGWLDHRVGNVAYERCNERVAR